MAGGCAHPLSVGALTRQLPAGAARQGCSAAACPARALGVLRGGHRSVVASGRRQCAPLRRARGQLMPCDVDAAAAPSGATPSAAAAPRHPIAWPHCVDVSPCRLWSRAPGWCGTPCAPAARAQSPRCSPAALIGRGVGWPRVGPPSLLTNPCFDHIKLGNPPPRRAAASQGPRTAPFARGGSQRPNGAGAVPAPGRAQPRAPASRVIEGTVTTVAERAQP